MLENILEVLGIQYSRTCSIQGLEREWEKKYWPSQLLVALISIHSIHNFRGKKDVLLAVKSS